MERRKEALVLDLDGVLWNPYTAFYVFCSSMDGCFGWKAGTTKGVYDDIRKTADGSRAMDIFLSRISRLSGLKTREVKKDYLQCISELGKESIRGMAFSNLKELRKAARLYDLIILTRGDTGIQLEKIDALGDIRRGLFAKVIVTSLSKGPDIIATLSLYDRVVFVDDKLSELEDVCKSVVTHPNYLWCRIGYCWYGGDPEKVPLYFPAFIANGEILLKKVEVIFAMLRKNSHE